MLAGLFMTSVSVMMWLSLGKDRDPWSLTELDGRAAWRLRLGPTRGATASVTAVCLVLGLGLAFAAADVGSVGGAVPLGALAAFVLVVGVSLSLVAVRAPSFTIGVDRLVHDGAGVRVELDWDDVGIVDWSREPGRWAAIRVSAIVNASSYRATRRWVVLPLDRLPPRPGIELRLQLLADTTATLRLLRELHVGERAGRESLIARGLPADSGR